MARYKNARTNKKGGNGSTGNRFGGPADQAKPTASHKKKSKLVITFDAEKRTEYLTGFSKRKQERRRFGLDMEAFKQKKRLMEAKKQRREEQKEKLASLNIKLGEESEKEEEDDDDENDSDSENDDPLSTKTKTKVLHFDDEHTQGKFGNVVTVTTSVGDLKSESEGELSEDDFSEDEETTKKRKDFTLNRYGKPKEKQLTLFQRIQLKRKGKALPSKRAKIKEARTNRNNMLNNKKAGKKNKLAGGGKRGAADAAATDAAPTKGGGKQQRSNKRQKK